MAIPKWKDSEELPPCFWEEKSNVPIDALFMDDGCFVSFNKTLWRIVYEWNDSYWVNTLSADNLVLLHKGIDGRYVMETPKTRSSDDLSKEWYVVICQSVLFEMTLEMAFRFLYKTRSCLISFKMKPMIFVGKGLRMYWKKVSHVLYLINKILSLGKFC